MACHSHNVVHQHVYIGEDVCIYVLQHIVGSVALSHYFIGSINKAVAKRLYLAYVTFNLELTSNMLQIFLFHDIYL